MHTEYCIVVMHWTMSLCSFLSASPSAHYTILLRLSAHRLLQQEHNERGREASPRRLCMLRSTLVHFHLDK